jgi:hypothetical protein
MGKNLEQILADATDGSQVGVTVVTNQDNGIASYATGLLIYHPGSLAGPFFRPARLSTSGGQPLSYYFSDRLLDIDPPAPAGSFPNTPRQPFSANSPDKLGLSISGFSLTTHVIKFTLHSWGNATFSVATEPRGNVLVGLGPAIGRSSDNAVYTVAFTGLLPRVR